MGPEAGGGSAMLIKNNQVLMSIGVLCLAAALLLKRFVGPSIGSPAWLDFIEGVLVGVSITVNTAYLIRLRKNKRRDEAR